MEKDAWIKEFKGAITVCDTDGIILEMNDKAAAGYSADGGYKLIGTSVFNCHPEAARSKLKALMKQRQNNSYTIEKNGVKKLVYQTPWYHNGEYHGFVEVVIEIPENMPHFVRAG